MKVCSCCKQEKDLSSFGKNKYNLDDYQYYCKTCRKEGYYKNRTLIINKSKLWYKENKELKQQYDRKRRLLFGDSLRQYDKDRSTTISRIINANKSTATRRAKKRNATVSWDVEFTSFVIKEAYALAKQREIIFGFKWHVDHIIPLQGKIVCGLHVWNNFQVIPAIINIKKSNHFERNV